MKKEDKELLLRDLCARLPYGVQCENVNHAYGKNIFKVTDIRDNGYICGTINNKHGWAVFDPLELKPYLFPLSSMTEEQKEEMVNKGIAYYQVFDGIGRRFFFKEGYELYDWFNKNHFDYRNLIGKNLAIDCTNLNIY